MSQGLPKHHKIEELWKHARGILSHTSSKNDLDVAEGCIIEFAKMDPTSESFRYPINREGKRSIEQDRLVISLRHLQEVMGRLGSFLDSSSEYMVILYDEKREFEDEY